ncbi:MAG TPA: hypothetical protein VE623_17475 [Acidimicrobiales bacterium]|nr:hypothetical protein [Acidimicrobiales bacterium]
MASLAVVAFSCTVPVTMWERSVLSESLGISTLALLVAATLVLARGVTGRRVVAVLGAAAVWLATRDSHASVVLVAAVCLAVGVVVAEWRAPSRQKGGDRDDEEGGEVDGEASRHDRSLDALIVLACGLFCLGVWLATHPTYLLTEPLRDPERTFNNALGDRSFYAPMDQREVPLVTDLLVPAGWLALVVVGGVAAWASWRRRWGSPLLLVGAITVALAVPHGLVSWHSDGMETARHLIVPVVQLHLGALLMVIGASVRIRDDLSPSGPPPQAA